jgi:hypothetical protein
MIQNESSFRSTKACFGSMFPPVEAQTRMVMSGSQTDAIVDRGQRADAYSSGSRSASLRLYPHDQLPASRQSRRQEQRRALKNLSLRRSERKAAGNTFVRQHLPMRQPDSFASRRHNTFRISDAKPETRYHLGLQNPPQVRLFGQVPLSAQAFLVTGCRMRVPLGQCSPRE